MTCRSHTEFSSLDSRLWYHKEVDLSLHPVVGLVLPVGDAEKFSHSLGLESLDPLLRVSKQGPCLTAKENSGDARPLQLEFTCEAHEVALPAV